jgi:hypothetical protein
METYELLGKHFQKQNFEKQRNLPAESNLRTTVTKKDEGLCRNFFFA